LVVLAALVVAISAEVAAPESSQDLFDFVQFMKRFEKSYRNKDEMNRAFANFRNSLQMIKLHNSADQQSKLSLNEFADQSWEDFSVRLGTSSGGIQAPSVHTPVSSPADLPASVDWREKNLVVPVKNQGSCGSCWTFSTVVSLEGQHAKVSNNLVALSEQNLVDCVKNELVPGTNETCCDGCNGGLMNVAFQYMLDHQDSGDDSETSYPYEGKDGSCRYSKEKLGATFKSWTAIPAKDENALLDAVANVGPISVGVNADFGWQLYSGGVYKGFLGLGCNSDPSKMNHGVAVVGYGTDNGQDYWIVRNSWGATWGESGYMRLARGTNQCGVANEASYPTVA
jgi:C1A family cysteine protease